MNPSDGYQSFAQRGVAVVVVREKRLLVIRRSQLVRAPGKLCFPGGGIEPDESEAEAVVREMQEELGVSVQPLRQLWQSVTPWGVELAWWQAVLEPNANLIANLNEVEAFLWLTPDEMLVLPDLLVSNGEFLRALQSGDFNLSTTVER